MGNATGPPRHRSGSQRERVDPRGHRRAQDLENPDGIRRGEACGQVAQTHVGVDWYWGDRERAVAPDQGDGGETHREPQTSIAALDVVAEERRVQDDQVGVEKPCLLLSGSAIVGIPRAWRAPTTSCARGRSRTSTRRDPGGDGGRRGWCSSRVGGCRPGRKSHARRGGSRRRQRHRGRQSRGRRRGRRSSPRDWGGRGREGARLTSSTPAVKASENFVTATAAPALPSHA